MATAKEKANDVLDVVERIAEVFAKVRSRSDDDDDDQDEEEDEAATERDEILGEILDASEEAQAQLAAALTSRARSLAKTIGSGDDGDEAAALGAVILRALAAHSQAEAFGSLMESPDLSHLLNVSEDDD